MQQDHTLALALLATATQADRTLVALLTKTTLELSRQVALHTATLATVQADNPWMKKSGQQSTTAGHGNWAYRNKTPSDTNLPKDCNLYSRSGQRFDPNGYCSSHGNKVEESNTSATCQFLHNNHNNSATRLNIIGRNTWNK